MPQGILCEKLLTLTTETMTKKEYAAPELHIIPVFTEAGFAQSGGAGYSATEGTENMTHDGAYMTL